MTAPPLRRVNRILRYHDFLINGATSPGSTSGTTLATFKTVQKDISSDGDLMQNSGGANFIALENNVLISVSMGIVVGAGGTGASPAVFLRHRLPGGAVTKEIVWQRTGTFSQGHQFGLMTLQTVMNIGDFIDVANLRTTNDDSTSSVLSFLALKN